jgi:hypothetical protein
MHIRAGAAGHLRPQQFRGRTRKMGGAYQYIGRVGATMTYVGAGSSGSQVGADV